MAPGSEPASGSVWAKQLSRSPRIGRHEVALAHLALQRIKRRSDFRSKNPHAARGQRHRAADLGPDNGAAELAEALAAEFLRHVDLPEAELLAAGGQLLFDLGLERGAVERFAFERDEFFVDEPPHHVAQHFQVVRKIKLHNSTRRLDEFGRRLAAIADNMKG